MSLSFFTAVEDIREAARRLAPVSSTTSLTEPRGGGATCPHVLFYI